MRNIITRFVEKLYYSDSDRGACRMQISRSEYEFIRAQAERWGVEMSYVETAFRSMEHFINEATKAESTELPSALRRLNLTAEELITHSQHERFLQICVRLEGLRYTPEYVETAQKVFGLRGMNVYLLIVNYPSEWMEHRHA